MVARPAIRDENPRADVRDLGLVAEVLATGRAVVAADDGQARSILVVRTRRGVLAVQNQCPHLGADLADGSIRGHKVSCARHGLRYDLRSGACLSRRRSGPLRIYRAWIESGHLFLASSVPGQPSPS